MNKNQALRDVILEPYWRDNEYAGGIRRFRELPSPIYGDLVIQGFVDPNDCFQEGYIELTELQSYLDRYPGTTLHGYAIEASREDYGLIIEGIEFKGETSKQQIIDTYKLFLNCDEVQLEESYLYVWAD